MATLDDLLALLPDNTAGDIGADDLRTIVTALWGHGWIGNAYSYSWTGNTTGLPATNKVNVAWATGSAVLHVSQQDGGSVMSPTGFFGTAGAKFELTTNDGTSVLKGSCVGTFTDQGNWFDVDITVDQAIGGIPAGNALLTLKSLFEVTS